MLIARGYDGRSPGDEYCCGGKAVDQVGLVTASDVRPGMVIGAMPVEDDEEEEEGAVMGLSNRLSDVEEFGGGSRITREEGDSYDF